MTTPESSASSLSDLLAAQSAGPSTPLRSFRLLDLLGIAVVVALMFVAGSLAGDPGVGWHLLTGRVIAETGAIPAFDPFLATSVEKPLIATQWLADLFLWGLFQLGGFTALSALVALCGVVTFLWIVPRTVLAADSRMSAPVLVVGVFLCLVPGAIQWFIRPVIFSFLFFAYLQLRLYQLRNGGSPDRRLLFIEIPVLFALWANLHSAFFLGIALYGLFLVERCFEMCAGRRRLGDVVRIGCAFAVAVGATFVNPYGAELHRNAFGLASSPFFQTLNTEWLPPTFADPFFAPFFLLAFGLALLQLCFHRTVGVWTGLTLILFVLLAFKGRRYIPFFAIVAAPVFIPLLQQLVSRVMAGLANKFSPFTAFVQPAPVQRIMFPWLSLLTLLCVAGNTADQKWELRRSFSFRPIAAADLIAQDGGAGVIFHSPDHGGYLSYRFFPARRAWLDDRNELNGEQIYRDYYTIIGAKAGWQNLVEQYRFQYLLIEQKAALFGEVSQNKCWQQLPLEKQSGEPPVAVFKRRVGQECDSAPLDSSATVAG